MEPLITFAFDDGWHCQYKNAIPILDRYGYRSTFYIITRYLENSADPKRMTKNEILKLYTDNHEIGAHSVTHPRLDKDHSKMHEIERSKQDLKACGITVKSFAYPYGRYDAVVREAVKKAGFANARAVIGDYNLPTTSKWDIPTQFVVRKTKTEDLEKWVQETVAHNYWTVLLFHDIDQNPNQYGCTPDVLFHACEIISKSKLKVLPLTEAYEYYHKVS